MRLVRPVVTLETERFILKPLRRYEAFRLSYPWTRDSELMLSVTQSSARRSARAWYKEMARPDNRSRFCHAIMPKGENRAIGMHTIRKSGYRSALLSVVIADRSWWGKNVVLEIRTRLIDHFIEQHSIERFWSTVTARNFASVFNYKKLGFDSVGTLHRAKADPVSGEVFDLIIFELMASNWKPRDHANAS